MKPLSKMSKNVIFSRPIPVKLSSFSRTFLEVFQRKFCLVLNFTTQIVNPHEVNPIPHPANVWIGVPFTCRNHSGNASTTVQQFNFYVLHSRTTLENYFMTRFFPSALFGPKRCHSLFRPGFAIIAHRHYLFCCAHRVVVVADMWKVSRATPRYATATIFMSAHDNENIFNAHSVLLPQITKVVAAVRWQWRALLC